MNSIDPGISPPRKASAALHKTQAKCVWRATGEFIKFLHKDINRWQTFRQIGRFRRTNSTTRFSKNLSTKETIFCQRHLRKKWVGPYLPWSRSLPFRTKQPVIHWEEKGCGRVTALQESGDVSARKQRTREPKTIVLQEFGDARRTSSRNWMKTVPPVCGAVSGTSKWREATTKTAHLESGAANEVYLPLSKIGLSQKEDLRGQ